ncbi:hypothetical protein BUY93_08050 [Mammaliicoccus fleurettii]|uniref:DUF4097 family beta strand repeat-containing protein n=1 Tax=unclassified Mammaliicoccus TaxID=2803851 RepID=UPI000E688431|nr:MULTISPECIES: DUF4097 family beta strand repeat-containing protein [unclassified Mammaliicoccus]RIL50148.1 hypothetical protein BUY93_08050 [Mammaliicoccus fleurettii]
MKKILWLLFSVGLILFIIFGVMMLREGQKLANNTSEKTLVNKTYENDIKNINVNGRDAAIKIKKGNQFKVKSVGSEDDLQVSSKVSGNNLNINVKNQYDIINFDFFRNMHNQIEVTVPEKLNHLNVKTDTGKINVKDIKSETSTFEVDTGRIDISSSQLGNLKVGSDTGEISLHHINFESSKLKTDTGAIEINGVPVDKPINIKTDTGSIKLIYNEVPKNTLLDIEQDVGNTKINQPELKNKKVGSGHNLVKITCDVGSVQID